MFLTFLIVNIYEDDHITIYYLKFKHTGKLFKLYFISSLKPPHIDSIHNSHTQLTILNPQTSDTYDT